MQRPPRNRCQSPPGRMQSEKRRSSLMKMMQHKLSVACGKVLCDNMDSSVVSAGLQCCMPHNASLSWWFAVYQRQQMDLVDRQDLLLTHSPMPPLVCHPGLAEANNTLQSLQS